MRRLKLSVRHVKPGAARCYTIRLDSTLSYKPGQSLAVFFPPDPKKRYYSISSSPSESSYVEITAQIPSPDHALAGIVPTLKRGDALDVEGPFGGKLGLPDSIDAPLCMVAAGTGVTPFRSMVKWLIDTSHGNDVWLLHSVKRREDLLFQDEFTSWAGSNRWFHYVATITQDFDDNWINETGRINETLVKKHIPEGPVTYLLCGPSEFVKDMEAMLTRQLQVPAESIRRDAW